MEQVSSSQFGRVLIPNSFVPPCHCSPSRGIVDKSEHNAGKSSQVAAPPLFLPQIPSSPNQPPSPKSPPLLQESPPNLLTMQARRPRRGVDGRRWRKCPLKRAPLDHICTMVSMIVEAPNMQKKWNVAEGRKRNNKRNCSHLIFV